MGLFFRPVKEQEIDCRIQSINDYFAIVLLYKDARVDQNLLDETVGAMNWQRSHTRDNHNCVVSIRDTDTGEWICKEDVGTESNTEAAKGLASDSFKRACVNWGIGRELYTAPIIKLNTEFLNVKTNRNGNPVTYDEIYVNKIDVEVDPETSAKRIVHLEIGIEYKGMREVVWEWTENSEIKQTCPSWKRQGNASAVYNQNNQNGYNNNGGNQYQNNGRQNNGSNQNISAPQNRNYGGNGYNGNQNGGYNQNNGNYSNGGQGNYSNPPAQNNGREWN